MRAQRQAAPSAGRASYDDAPTTWRQSRRGRRRVSAASAAAAVAAITAPARAAPLLDEGGGDDDDVDNDVDNDGAVDEESFGAIARCAPAAPRVYEGAAPDMHRLAAQRVSTSSWRGRPPRPGFRRGVSS